MAFNKKVTGAFTAGFPKKRVGGAWVDATSLLVRTAGAWVQKLVISLTQTRSATSSTTTGTSWTSPSNTVTPSGGTTYTYAWTWVTNPGGLTITSPTAATTTFSKSGLVVGAPYTGTARCTVTSGPLTATIDHTVSIERTNPA